MHELKLAFEQKFHRSITNKDDLFKVVVVAQVYMNIRWLVYDVYWPNRCKIHPTGGKPEFYDHAMFLVKQGIDKISAALQDGSLTALPGKERVAPKTAVGGIAENEDELTPEQEVTPPPKSELEYWKNKSHSLSKSNRQLEKHNEELGVIAYAHDKLVDTHDKLADHIINQDEDHKAERAGWLRKSAGEPKLAGAETVDGDSEDENEPPAVIVTPAPRKKKSAPAVISTTKKAARSAKKAATPARSTKKTATTARSAKKKAPSAASAPRNDTEVSHDFKEGDPIVVDPAKNSNYANWTGSVLYTSGEDYLQVLIFHPTDGRSANTRLKWTTLQRA